MGTGTGNNVKVEGKRRVRKSRRLLLGGIAATTALAAVGATAVAAHTGSASPVRSAHVTAHTPVHTTGSRNVQTEPAYPARSASETVHTATPPTSQAVSSKPASTAGTHAKAISIPPAGPSAQSFDYSFMTPSTGSLLSSINAAVGETGDEVNRIEDGQPLTDKEYSDGEAALEHPVDYGLQEGLLNDIDRIDHSIYNTNEQTTYGDTQVDGNGDVWNDGPTGWTSPTSSFTTPPFLFSDALPQSQSVAH